MKSKFSNLSWGIFLLLAAVFILVNQFNGFGNLRAGSIIAAVLALIFLVQCIANLHFSIIPIPLAILYIVFQDSLGLPHMQTWPLILAAVLASIGLSVIFPKRHWHGGRRHRHHCGSDDHQQINTVNCNEDNNPSVSVNFGAKSRRLHSDNLETADLNCSFGALEIFLDEAKPGPAGAEAVLNCRFGAIELFVPKDWHIVDKINCSVGGVNIDRRFSANNADAPQLILTGNVSFGGIEVRCI